jgi:hypothetical protein
MFPDGNVDEWDIVVNGEPLGAGDLSELIERMPARVSDIRISHEDHQVSFSTGTEAKSTLWVDGDGYTLGRLVAVVEANTIALRRLRRVRTAMPWSRQEWAVSVRSREAIEQRDESRRLAWVGALAGVGGGVLGGIATSIVAAVLGSS